MESRHVKSFLLSASFHENSYKRHDGFIPRLMLSENCTIISTKQKLESIHKLHRAKPSLRSQYSLTLIVLLFFIPEDLLPCSGQTANDPYLKPDESNPILKSLMLFSHLSLGLQSGPLPSVLSSKLFMHISENTHM